MIVFNITMNSFTQKSVFETDFYGAILMRLFFGNFNKTFFSTFQAVWAYIWYNWIKYDEVW